MIVMFRAEASMLFSTNSATALRGFCCESAIMVIAFQYRQSAAGRNSSSYLRYLFRKVFARFSEDCDRMQVELVFPERRGAMQFLQGRQRPQSGRRCEDTTPYLFFGEQVFEICFREAAGEAFLAQDIGDGLGFALLEFPNFFLDRSW